MSVHQGQCSPSVFPRGNQTEQVSAVRVCMGVWVVGICLADFICTLTATERTRQPKMSFLGPLLALTLLLQGAFGDSVPALLWSNQANAPEAVSHVSTLVDQIEPADLLSEYAKHKVRVVALVQGDLNVEQFAANDAPFVSAIFDKTAAHPVSQQLYSNDQYIFDTFLCHPVRLSLPM